MPTPPKESDRAAAVRKAGGLPPPGHKRDELLKRRQDALESQAAKAGAQIVGGTVPLTELEIEREVFKVLTQQGGGHKIKGARPEYFYAWQPYRTPRGGETTEVIDRVCMLPGWSKVSGSDPEEIDRKAPDGTRRLVDCMLLKCRKDYRLAYEKVTNDMNAKRSAPESSNAALAGQAAQARAAGLALIHTDPNSPEFQRFVKSMFASEAATQEFTRRLNTGTIPGREINTP